MPCSRSLAAKELTRCLDAVKKGGRMAYPNGIGEPEPRKRKGLRMTSYDAEAGSASSLSA